MRNISSGRKSREWLELGEFSVSVNMKKLHEVHPKGKNSWVLVISQKKKIQQLILQPEGQ